MAIGAPGSKTLFRYPSSPSGFRLSDWKLERKSNPIIPLTAAMNSDKQQCSPVPPPYRISNEHSKYTEKESNDARKLLSRIVVEENKRIQKVAGKENERIMKDLRIKYQ